MEEDIIKNPSHYKVCGVDSKNILNYLVGVENAPYVWLWNAMKYLIRFNRKNSNVEDLRKAKEYISWVLASGKCVLINRRDSKLYEVFNVSMKDIVTATATSKYESNVLSGIWFCIFKCDYEKAISKLDEYIKYLEGEVNG